MKCGEGQWCERVAGLGHLGKGLVGTVIPLKSRHNRDSCLVDAALCISIASLAFSLYLRTLAPSVLISDPGEYQFVLYELGIPHPTGYPLYVLLGYLWSRLPIGSVAYRINLLSAV
ncbi:MAG: DUF2723 domain-containing protein, partial [Chloroflexi bacterium]|nr:DUF2723 domain-containing protein [Chloroflexota bacterium]